MKKINIFSPRLHQDLYQKLIKGFTNYIPIHLTLKVLNEDDIDLVIDGTVNKDEFEKSGTEIERYESVEELKFPEECADGGQIFLDVLNGKVMNDPRVQAMFKGSSHYSS